MTTHRLFKELSLYYDSIMFSISQIRYGVVEFFLESCVLNLESILLTSAYP